MPVKGLHRWLLGGVSPLGLRAGAPVVANTKPLKPAPQRRRGRAAARPNGSPLVFETLEPRVLLSGDPMTVLTAPVQNGILAGLQALQNWSHQGLDQSAALVQQLPVVSTSLGTLVDVPATLQQHVVSPVQSYFASTNAPTVSGLVNALKADPADTGVQLGGVGQSEFLITLSAQSTTPITQALNVSEDTAGINLQVGSGPVLTGNATVNATLTFGFDSTTGNTFFQPSQITQAIALSSSSFNDTAQSRRRGHGRHRWQRVHHGDRDHQSRRSAQHRHQSRDHHGRPQRGADRHVGPDHDHRHRIACPGRSPRAW